MCGIAGYVTTKPTARQYQDVYPQMLSKLQNRGPDSNGIYLNDHVCLLHTRLAVIDLENGSQPMTFKRGDHEVTLVYNGELYNTAEIRKELELAGYSFFGRCDTEVVLKSYIEWGAECVEKFNGIYAFAVWDSSESTLFIARDRMGVKPFFYAIVNGQFIFASEIKALLCHPEVKPEINAHSISEIMLLGPGRTSGYGVFRQIEELKPGYSGTFKNGQLKSAPYWQLTAKPHMQDFDTTLEVIRYLVKDAIKRQSISDVPLCSFLSGGLDSSIIAALSGVEHTFSVDYLENDKYFKSSRFQPDSDSSYIDLMTKHLGTKHTAITLDTEELVNALFDAVNARDLPGMADVDSSLLLFCKEVRKHAVVALSGECADELFGGYPWFRDKEIRERYGFPWSQSTEYRKSFLRPDVLGEIDALEYVHDKYNDTISSTDYLADDDSLEKRMKEMTSLNVNWFMQTLLDRKDRMSMYNALEVRVPFCDHRLAQYLYNVPWKYKDYLGREKGLLREAMKGLLPEEVLWRKKSPYPKTHHPEYLKQVAKLMKDVLANLNSPLFEIVDRESVRRLLDDTPEIPWYGQLMAGPQTIAYLLQVNYWMEKYHVSIC